MSKKVKVGEIVLYNNRVLVEEGPNQPSKMEIYQRPGIVIGVYDDNVVDLQVFVHPKQDRQAFDLSLQDRNPVLFKGEVEYSEEPEHNHWS